MAEVLSVPPTKAAELIWRAQQAGAVHLVPLLRRASRGDFDAVFLPPGQRIPHRFLDPSRNRRPLVVVLSGDAGLQVGPESFPQARRLFGWAKWCCIHGAGGEPEHYGLVSEMTTIFSSVLLVECTSATLPDWIAFKLRVAPLIPSLAISVPPGRPTHPDYSRETRQ